MLMRCQNIVWIALALCLAAAFGAAVWNASHTPQSPSHHATTKNEHKTTPKTIEERHQATEEAIASYNLWIMAFTGVLAFATAGLWAMNFFQLRLARAEFMSTHRPKIRIKHVLMTTELWYDHPIKVRIVYVNHGAADAVMSDYGVELVVLTAGNPLPSDLTIEPVKIEGRLESGISLKLPDFRYALTEANEIAIRNRNANMYCVGYVHYRDASNRLRTTAFCRILKLAPFRGGGHFIATPNEPDYEYED